MIDIAPHPAAFSSRSSSPDPRPGGLQRPPPLPYLEPPPSTAEASCTARKPTRRAGQLTGNESFDRIPEPTLRRSFHREESGLRFEANVTLHIPYGITGATVRRAANTEQAFPFSEDLPVIDVIGSCAT